MQSNKHTTVLIGNFGSGKSELALNMVIRSAEAGVKTVLVDLDLINPYFRSSDMVEELEKRGITLKKPLYANTGVEAPSLPPDIYAVFIDENENVVFDVGGDPTGAIALGQYKRNFDSLENLDVLFVINPKRPLSATPEAVMELIDAVSSVSRLTVTGFINNSNLSNETTPEDIMDGLEVISRVSQDTGIPVKYTAGETKVLNTFLKMAEEKGVDPQFIGEPMPIVRYMRRDWERFTSDVNFQE